MIYCISDIHGCYNEFMELLEKIQFDPVNDTIYILGDVVDRGKRPVDCLKFVIDAKNIVLINGNHELMMLEYFDKTSKGWNTLGNAETKGQLSKLHESERGEILSYTRKSLYFKVIRVNGQKYFLSHSGLDASKPFHSQTKEVLVWGRGEFYRHKALDEYICIFGHTPTFFLRNGNDCSIWFDPLHNDKICIDCGWVFGGALAALRLDDGKVFYVQSELFRDRRHDNDMKGK